MDDIQMEEEYVNLRSTDGGNYRLCVPQCPSSDISGGRPVLYGGGDRFGGGARPAGDLPRLYAAARRID